MASGEEKPLNPAFLQDALRGQVIGSRIIVLAETTSTNDDAFRLGADGAEEGLVVFAEHQTAGRGRHGNRWESSAGKGLWLSILLRPLIAAPATARLTDWAAAAIVSATQQETGATARIKPPNDVTIDNRKVAGVLVEMRAQPKQPHLAIVGIGINVNQAAEDFGSPLRGIATSLAMAKGNRVDRDSLAVTLLRHLEKSYASILAA